MTRVQQERRQIGAAVQGRDGQRRDGPERCGGEVVRGLLSGVLLLALAGPMSPACAANKVTTYTYDDYANRTSETISGFTPTGTPVSRTTTWQYNGPLHQLSLMDGPRTDVSDVTYYRYYADAPTEGANRARLKEIENALGTLVRSNIQYSATGQVLSESRPNGVTLTYTYYPGNDRLQTLTEAGGGDSRTTRWTYENTGEVKTITQGDGTADATTLTFGYDAARRLTSITDGLGNHIDYTLDTEGNRQFEQTYDSTGTLKRQLGQTFDLYNRLDVSTETHDQRDYDYAPDGTLDQLTEGNGTVTDYGYDDLKRLTQTVQDIGGTDPTTADATSTYHYDAGDRLTQVTDADGHTTTYAYDDLGNLLSQTSPDSGTTTYTYDSAGNLKTRTDARGVTVSYSYDALNRLTAIDYPGTAEDVVYQYDTGTNRVGRLNWFTDQSGKTQYFYNALGDIKQVQRTLNGQIYATLYNYDGAGRLKWNKFPSTRTLTRTRNANGDITKITMNFDGQTSTLADQIGYAPFGPIESLTYGNGLTETTDLALDYRFTNQTNPSVRNRGYGYDTAGNLTSLLDLLNSSLDQGFGYDALSRLNQETGANAQTFQYDLNGNRTQQVTSWTTNYQYDPNSNRLTQVGSQTAQTYDPMGNTLTAHNGQHGYTYNQAGRLAEFRKNGVLRGGYTYNSLGQRVIGRLYNSSGVQTATILYLYDLDGTLESELRISTAGQLQHETDYVNLDQRPLAWTRGYYNAQGNLWKKEVYYLHTDQLDTPRLATDAQQTVVWRWDGDGFGDTPADTDPDGDGTQVNINLRFPGQYYDSESGLHYNYFRYYDPSTGRYITSDPIGLQGGFNTYAYVNGNPNSYIDSMGLLGNCGMPGGSCGPNSRTTPRFPGSSCGPEGSLYNYPNQFWGGANIESACQSHDQCYSDCNKTKNQCDQELYFDIRQICSQARDPVACNIASILYYTAVARRGEIPYENAQKQTNCDCESE